MRRHSRWWGLLLLVMLLGRPWVAEGKPPATAGDPGTATSEHAKTLEDQVNCEWPSLKLVSSEHAKTLKAQGKLEDALEEARTDARAKGDAQSHYVLAWILVKMQKKGEAVTEFQKALKAGLQSKEAQEARKALDRLGGAVPKEAVPLLPSTSKSPSVPQAKREPQPGKSVESPAPNLTAKSKTPPGTPSSRTASQPAASSGTTAPAGREKQPSTGRGILIAGGVLAVLILVFAGAMMKRKKAGTGAARATAAALPEYITLAPVSFTEHKVDTRKMDLFTHELEHNAFQSIGDYQIPELQGNPYLRAFVNAGDNTYAIINFAPALSANPWVDMLSAFTGNSFLTTTTANSVEELHRPPTLRLQKFPKAAMEGLLEKHKEMAARIITTEGLQILPISAETFIDHFIETYEQERLFRSGKSKPAGGGRGESPRDATQTVMPEFAFAGAEAAQAAAPMLTPQPQAPTPSRTVAAPDFDFAPVGGEAPEPARAIADQPSQPETAAPAATESSPISFESPPSDSMVIDLSVETQQPPPTQPAAEPAVPEGVTFEGPSTPVGAEPYEVTPFDLLASTEKSAPEPPKADATPSAGTAQSAPEPPAVQSTTEFGMPFEIPEFEAKPFEADAKDPDKPGSAAGEVESAEAPLTFHLEAPDKPVDAGKQEQDGGSVFSLDDEPAKKATKDKPA